MLWSRPALALVILAHASWLAAQETAVQALDLTKREDVLSSRSWLAPEASGQFESTQAWPGSQSIRFDSWHGKFTSLGRKRAAFTLEEAREKEMLDLGEVRSFDRRNQAETISRESGRRSAFRNFGQIGAAESYPADSGLQSLIPDGTAQVTREEFIAGQRSPKMEDINRYVFRKNGVDERGALPVTPAAGGAGREDNRNGGRR